MRFSKTGKIALAVATVWPVIYMVLFIAVFFGHMLSTVASHGGAGSHSDFPISFLIIFPLHLLTAIEMMAVTVIYIVDVFKNDRVQNDLKALWAIVIFFGSTIGMAVYFVMFIWPEMPERTVG